MNKIPYVCLEVKLFNLIENPQSLINDLKEYLKLHLNPNFDSDIEIELIESAGYEQNKSTSDT